MCAREREGGREGGKERGHPENESLHAFLRCAAIGFGARGGARPPASAWSKPADFAVPGGTDGPCAWRSNRLR